MGVGEDIEPEVVERSGLNIAFQGGQCLVVRVKSSTLQFACGDLLCCWRSSARDVCKASFVGFLKLGGPLYILSAPIGLPPLALPFFLGRRLPTRTPSVTF